MINNLRQGIIIQARIGSTRYPSKVLEKIDGNSLLQILFKRLNKCNSISNIIYAIPETDENLKMYANKNL